jgi:hypothetical protein
MYCPVAPEGPPRRESVPLGGEMSPSGDQNEPKGLREGRIAALLPRTLVPGASEAALLPSPSDPWSRLTYQSATYPVQRVIGFASASQASSLPIPNGAIEATLEGQRWWCREHTDAVIAHWGADPNRLSGKRQSLPFGYVLPGSPRTEIKAGKRALRRGNRPFGRSK